MTDDGPMEVDGAIDRFDHVSMAVRDFNDVSPLLALLGAEYFDGGHADAGAFDWVQYTLPGGARLELIATDEDDPGHFINRFLAERGPGLHHLTFRVDDITAAAAAARGAGFEVVGFDDRDAGWKELFLHPRTANGVLIQLAEFPEK